VNITVAETASLTDHKDLSVSELAGNVLGKLTILWWTGRIDGMGDTSFDSLWRYYTLSMACDNPN
jgi:hypothetical protein